MYSYLTIFWGEGEGDTTSCNSNRRERADVTCTDSTRARSAGSARNAGPVNGRAGPGQVHSHRRGMGSGWGTWAWPSYSQNRVHPAFKPAPFRCLRTVAGPQLPGSFLNQDGITDCLCSQRAMSCKEQQSKLLVLKPTYRLEWNRSRTSFTGAAAAAPQEVI